LLAATAEQGLEGVVAKRLDAPYLAGRRSQAWIKHKHRRRETFVVTGWRAREGTFDEFLLARRGPDGRLRPAGSASLGLDSVRRAELVAAIADLALPSRGRGSVRWASPVIEVAADVDGPVDGPVRDAVLREVALPS
jgi:bifunctional non-homologous end joining protein LigD